MSAVPPWLIFSPRDPRIARPPAGRDQTPTAGKRERRSWLPAMIVACPRPQRLPESRSDARFETSPVLCRFSDAGMRAIHALQRPASEKRQCTKSREVWHPAVQRVLWGSYVGGDLDGGRDASRMLPQLSRFGMNVAQEYF